MADELTPEDQALLDGLETLFEPRREETVPDEFTATLKRQVRDRLAPERMSLGETVALAVIAVIGLGLGGMHGWSPILMVASAAVVGGFLWIAPRVRAGREADEDGEEA